MGFIFRRALLPCMVISFYLSNAQDDRAQYPQFLQKAYFGVDAGWLNYAFSNKNLPVDYYAQTIVIPHMAPRLTLFGYQFNHNFSARITYMRPVQWVLYKNLNGDQLKHSVWMNIAGATAKEDLRLTGRLSMYGEAGLALITRNGFDIDGYPVVSDASYSTFSAGGGLAFRVNPKWDLDLYGSFSPGKHNIQQPATVFIGGGFAYHMHPLSPEKGMSISSDKRMFPGQVIQFAFTTNKLGYGANHFFAEGKVPVFWGGLVETESGLAVNYTRNIFHTRKVFSLDIGASAGSWESKGMDRSFYALSIYPVLRFTVIRSQLADAYFFYSVAGPSFISKTQIDNENTGRHFTFRDYMGIGTYVGHREILNAELSIGHFSNGNIFPDNAGVKVPLTLSVGYAFGK